MRPCGLLPGTRLLRLACACLVLCPATASPHTSAKASNVTVQAQFQVEAGAHFIVDIGLHREVIQSQGPGSYVIGVEASLSSLATFWDKLKQKNVFLINAAVFDTPGVMILQELAGWPAANSLVSNAGIYKYQGEFTVTGQSPVPTVRLDSILRLVPHGSSLDLLKVDAQGVNVNVIKSAGSDIGKFRVIFTECERGGKRGSMSSTGEHVESGTGMSGVEVYGNKEDTCENIREYLEGFGFVYLGLFGERETDLSADIAVAAPKHVNLVKTCVRNFQGKNKKGEEKKCFIRKMYEYQGGRGQVEHPPLELPVTLGGVSCTKHPKWCQWKLKQRGL